MNTLRPPLAEGVKAPNCSKSSPRPARCSLPATGNDRTRKPSGASCGRHGRCGWPGGTANPRRQRSPLRPIGAARQRLGQSPCSGVALGHGSFPRCAGSRRGPCPFPQANRWRSRHRAAGPARRRKNEPEDHGHPLRGLSTFPCTTGNLIWSAGLTLCPPAGYPRSDGREHEAAEKSTRRGCGVWVLPGSARARTPAGPLPPASGLAGLQAIEKAVSRRKNAPVSRKT